MTIAASVVRYPSHAQIASTAVLCLSTGWSTEAGHVQMALHELSARLKARSSELDARCGATLVESSASGVADDSLQPAQPVDA